MDLNLRYEFMWHKEVCTKQIAWRPNVFKKNLTSRVVLYFYEKLNHVQNSVPILKIDKLGLHGARNFWITARYRKSNNINSYSSVYFKCEPRLFWFDVACSTAQKNKRSNNSRWSIVVKTTNFLNSLLFVHP